jgi:hypothetical protein
MHYSLVQVQCGDHIFCLRLAHANWPYSDSLNFHSTHTAEIVARTMLVLELNLLFSATLRFFEY